MLLLRSAGMEYIQVEDILMCRLSLKPAIL